MYELLGFCKAYKLYLFTRSFIPYMYHMSYLVTLTFYLLFIKNNIGH